MYHFVSRNIIKGYKHWNCVLQKHTKVAVCVQILDQNLYWFVPFSLLILDFMLLPLSHSKLCHKILMDYPIIMFWWCSISCSRTQVLQCCLRYYDFNVHFCCGYAGAVLQMFLSWRSPEDWSSAHFQLPERLCLRKGWKFLSPSLSAYKCFVLFLLALLLKVNETETNHAFL